MGLIKQKKVVFTCMNKLQQIENHRSSDDARRFSVLHLRTKKEKKIIS